MTFSGHSSKEDDQFSENGEEVTEKASLPQKEALPSATVQEVFELERRGDSLLLNLNNMVGRI